MFSMYPAIFFHKKTGEYSVVFPDFNHLSTCGSTLQEAIEMAIDCLAGYIYSEQLAGHLLPNPTPLDKVSKCSEDTPADDYIDYFVNIVTVDVKEYARKRFGKSVKKTLSIPQWLNDMAIAKNINFSRVLQSALKNELKIDNV